MSGFMAPKRSANANCKRCTGWIERVTATAKLISGRFERAARSIVMTIRAAAMSAGLRAPAGNGFPARALKRLDEAGDSVERQRRALTPARRHQPGARTGRETCPP